MAGPEAKPFQRKLREFKRINPFLKTATYKLNQLNQSKFF
jgi:hypothetical protein